MCVSGFPLSVFFCYAQNFLIFVRGLSFLCYFFFGITP